MGSHTARREGDGDSIHKLQNRENNEMSKPSERGGPEVIYGKEFGPKTLVNFLLVKIVVYKNCLLFTFPFLRHFRFTFTFAIIFIQISVE